MAQTYYLPLPEDQLLEALTQIENGGPSDNPDSPIINRISIAAIANNTLIYYDQGENGYDPVIDNPINIYSSTNLGGTQIWGDGDTSNGFPPGVNSDLINSGTVIVLEASVAVPFASGTFPFGGGDKLASTKTISVVRAGWATTTGTLFAGSNEVFDTANWGVEYRVPVGENTSSQQMFEYVGLHLMAGQDGATLQIDADASGNFETTVTLTEGESYHVNGNVNEGARILSDNPVQVDMITGDVTSNYESRFIHLSPLSLWSDKYVTPVSTRSSDATTVWLFNPTSSTLAVTYTTRNGTGNLVTSTLSVPAGGSNSQVLTDGYGAKFEATGTPFYAISTIDSNGTDASDNQSADWGFSLIPQGSATPQVLVGLGIGRDPTSTINPNENGSPVWVTPVGNGNTAITVYVDYDANPLTGTTAHANGVRYDSSYSLRELDVQRIFDPDGEQTGMLIYVLDPDIKLAAAWGQDPSVASTGAPGLDMGTGVPPLPSFVATKRSVLLIDNDSDGNISPGDVLEYEVAIENTSRFPVPDISILDHLPASVTYNLGSTAFVNANDVTLPIPDNASASFFPLSSDFDLSQFDDDNDGNGNLPVSGNWAVTYAVTVKNYADLNGAIQIENAATINAVEIVALSSSVDVISGKIGDYVWFDANANGLQDSGETGINGITVRILDASGHPVLDDNNQPYVTTTADDDENHSGFYQFKGVPGGDYLLEFETSEAYAFTLLDQDNQGVSGGQNSDVIRDTGRTTVFTLNGGETADYVDAGLVNASMIGNFVWMDVNGNGRQDSGEWGLNGVTVNLLNAAGSLLDTTTTADEGSNPGYYEFSGITDGQYQVEFVAPANHAFTTQNADNDGVTGSENSDASIADGKTELFSVAIDTSLNTIDAGLLSADLQLGQRIENAVVNEGNSTTFTITVTNLGPTQATGIEISTAGLPAGLSFDSASPDQGNFNDSTQRWDLGTLAVNASATMTYVVDVDADTIGDTLTHTANIIHSDVPDANSANNSDTVSVYVSGLVISKSVSPVGQVNHGGTLSYTIRVENEGASDQTNVQVIDILPAGMTYTPNSIQGMLSKAPAPGNYTETFDSSGTFTVPVGVSSLTVEAWGAGGSGGDEGGSNGRGGGGGGAYARSVVSVSDLQVYTVTVGEGGESTTNTSNPGGDSTFSIGNTTWVRADGGAAGTNSGETGGTIANSIGTTRFAGGSGGNRSSNKKHGGGGGGSATSTANGGNGNNASNNAPGTGGTGQGAGGNGGSSRNVGQNGSAPGGGGGGRGEEGVNGLASGNGADGRVVITYTIPSAIGTIAAPSGIIAEGWTIPAGEYLELNFDVSVASVAGFSTLTNLASVTSDQVSSPLESSAQTSVNGGSIGNFVWVDTNGDGIQNNEEPGLENVQVTLLNSTGTTTIQDVNGQDLAVLTDPNGAYSLGTLPSGTYRVHFSKPAGYEFSPLNADENGISGNENSDADPASGQTVTISITAGQDIAYVAAGFYQPGSITGTVGIDTSGDGNSNGPQDGVSITLITLADDSVVTSTTTDANGAYSFSDLPPGSYRIDQNVPSSFMAVKDVDGGDLTQNGDQTPITVSSNDDVTNQSFVNSPEAVIAGFVWVDTNGNGLQDEGETGLENSTIALLDHEGHPLLNGQDVPITTTSDALGIYTFTGLLAGEYLLKFTGPAGYEHTIQDADSNGLSGSKNSDANASTGITPTLSLSVGQRMDTIDAGFYQPGSITGTVGIDTSGDGNSNGPQDGVSITLLTLADDSVVTSTTTDANGDYSFSDLPPGSYRIDQNVPSSFIAVKDVDGGDLTQNGDQTPITVSSNDDVTNQSFVNRFNGIITGSIEIDETGNDEGDAPQAGVSLVLTDENDNEVDTTTTATDGSYTFNNLPQGSYKVWQTLPHGFKAVADADGGDLEINGDISLITINTSTGSRTGQSFVNSQSGTVTVPDFCLNLGTTLEGLFIRPTNMPSNVVYVLEYADILEAPTTWDGSVTLNGSNTTVLDNGDGTESVSILDIPTLTSLGAGNGFVRLRIETDFNNDETVDENVVSKVSGWVDSEFGSSCRTYNNPFLSCPHFSAEVISATGNTLTFTENVPALGLGSYYAEVISGANEGQRFDIVSTGDNSITVAQDLDNCDNSAPFNTITGQLPDLMVGNNIVLRKHQNLNDWFPVDQMTANNDQALADQISLWDGTTFQCYYLYDGGSPHWVLIGDETLSDIGNVVIIPPGVGVFMNSKASKTLRAYGQVRENDFIRPVCVDMNVMAGAYPVDQSANSRNMASPVFKGNPDFKLSDQFWIWRGDEVSGRTSYLTYVLLDNTTFTGWIKFGDIFSTDISEQTLFKRDNAVIIDSRTGNASYQYAAPWTP
ncbi:SdrD B-like domain-containing protein [Kiritimatiellota bacterium B12222]|nr:SdrD B-like domain-containing protein [Kiritimatiellota bacterium B12222]